MPSQISCWTWRGCRRRRRRSRLRRLPRRPRVRARRLFFLVSPFRRVRRRRDGRLGRVLFGFPRRLVVPEAVPLDEHLARLDGDDALGAEVIRGEVRAHLRVLKRRAVAFPVSAEFPLGRLAHRPQRKPLEFPVREVLELAQKFNRAVGSAGAGRRARATSRREDGVDLTLAQHTPRRLLERGARGAGSLRLRLRRRRLRLARRAEPSTARNLRQFRTEAVDVVPRVALVAEDHLTLVVALLTPGARDDVHGRLAGIRVRLAIAHPAGLAASRGLAATAATTTSGDAGASRVIGIVAGRMQRRRRRRRRAGGAASARARGLPRTFRLHHAEIVVVVVVVVVGSGFSRTFASRVCGVGVGVGASVVARVARVRVDQVPEFRGRGAARLGLRAVWASPRASRNARKLGSEAVHVESLRALVAEHEVALVVALPALGARDVLGVARERGELDVAPVGDGDDVGVGVGTRGRFLRHGA